MYLSVWYFSRCIFIPNKVLSSNRFIHPSIHFQSKSRMRTCLHCFRHVLCINNTRMCLPSTHHTKGSLSQLYRRLSHVDTSAHIIFCFFRFFLCCLFWFAHRNHNRTSNEVYNAPARILFFHNSPWALDFSLWPNLRMSYMLVLFASPAFLLVELENWINEKWCAWAGPSSSRATVKLLPRLTVARESAATAHQPNQIRFSQCLLSEPLSWVELTSARARPATVIAEYSSWILAYWD